MCPVEGRSEENTHTDLCRLPLSQEDLKGTADWRPAGRVCAGLSESLVVLSDPAETVKASGEGHQGKGHRTGVMLRCSRKDKSSPVYSLKRVQDTLTGTA